MGRKRLESVEVESGAVVQVGSDVVLEVEGEDQPCVASVSQIFVDKKDRAKMSVYWYYFPADVKRGRQSYHAVDEIFRSDHHQSDPLVSSKTVIWTCTVLPLGKWIAFLDSPCNPNGQTRKRGPVPPDDFDPLKDLAACKTLGKPGAPLKGKEDVSVANGGSKPKNGAAAGNSDEEEADGYDSDDDKNRVYMCRHEYLAEKQQWKDVEVPVFCTCDLPYNPDYEMIQCNTCGEWYHPSCLGLKEEQVAAINDGEAWTCGQETCTEAKDMELTVPVRNTRQDIQDRHAGEEN